MVADLLPNPWTVSPNSPPNFEWYIKVVTSHQTTHHHGEEGGGDKRRERPKWSVKNGMKSSMDSVE